MSFVLDCSVTMAWAFEDEFDARAAAIRQRLRAENALVPAIWRSEVANVLLMGERRKRMDESRALAFMNLLDELPIELDAEESWPSIREATRLAREHKLSVYDATYVELALRHRIPLATLDEKLSGVVARLGLPELKMP